MCLFAVAQVAYALAFDIPLATWPLSVERAASAGLRRGRLPCLCFLGANSVLMRYVGPGLHHFNIRHVLAGHCSSPIREVSWRLHQPRWRRSELPCSSSATSASP
uniref:Secreted protein n=1 Tax=Macrostomum lignano TaxID=282301 RepID=A0A1I8F6A1_9PLAT